MRDPEALAALFAQRLAEAIRRSGKKLVEIQEECDGEPSDSAMGSWRRGLSEPGAFLLARVADALGVTVGYLLGEEQVPPVGRTVLDRSAVEAICACEDPAEMPALLPKTKPFAFAVLIPGGAELVSEQLARAEEERAWNHVRAVAPELRECAKRLRDGTAAGAAGNLQALDGAQC